MSGWTISAMSFLRRSRLSLRPKAQFIASMNEDAEKYLALVRTLEDAHTARFMAEGLTEKAARAKASKQANEDARFVLPNACETKDGHDDELPQPAEFLQSALLQPRPVGDTRCGR